MTTYLILCRAFFVGHVVFCMLLLWMSAIVGPCITLSLFRQHVLYLNLPAFVSAAVLRAGCEKTYLTCIMGVSHLSLGRLQPWCWEGSYQEYTYLARRSIWYYVNQSRNSVSNIKATSVGVSIIGKRLARCIPIVTYLERFLVFVQNFGFLVKLVQVCWI